MSLVTPSVGEARHGARRAGESHWIDKLARVGLAARGLVYLLVGYFALQIAFGHSSRQASRNGAFHAIARRSWGPALLWVMAIGFFGYAAWRVSEAAWGHRDEESTAKRTGKRAYSFGRGVLYAFIGYSAASLASGGGSGSSGGSGGNGGARSASASLMKQSYGVPLLTAIGAGIVVAGAVLAWRGLRKKFEDSLKTEQMSTRTRSVVTKVGMAGIAARGVVLAIIGGFVIDAALTFDPKKAKGLDGSLRSLAATGWGKVVLVLIAIGLLAFGVYSFFEARYRRTGNERGGSAGSAAYPSSQRVGSPARRPA